MGGVWPRPGPTTSRRHSAAIAPVAKAAETGPVSRGYTEEIEHWAYCIRHPDKSRSGEDNPSNDNVPRCRPEVALGDAVIALTANTAIRKSSKGGNGYLNFDDAWFNIDDDATPDGSSVATEKNSLLK